MAHITLQQLVTVLGRIVTWSTSKFAARSVNSGKLKYEDMPVVVLASMGHELDGTDNDMPMSVGDTYFLPAGGVGTTPRIMYRPDSGNPVKISDPESGVIYCNAYTGLLYRWDSTTGNMVSVGGDGDGLRTVYVSNNSLSSLDALHSAETAGVYHVIDQTSQRIIGVLIVSCDVGSGLSISTTHFVTQWLFSNVALQDDYSGSISGHYVKGKAHIIHRFYNVSTPVSDSNTIPLNTWSDWRVYGLTLDEIPTVPTMDAVPTIGNTTHTVSSDGVASALNNLLTNLRIVNGEWYIGNTATGVSAQGPQGSCAITGDGSNIISIIVNNLVTGGAGNILSAEQGKVLKGKIDEVQANVVNLYNRLGNMAFWSATDKAAAEPAELDWSIAKVTVTVTNNIGANIAVIKRYGQAVSGSVMVDQGDSLTLTIEGADGYGLTSVFAAIDGGSATALTGVNGVFTLNVAQVNAAMSIVITGTYSQTVGITYNLTNCTKTSGPTSVVTGGGATIEITADEGCTLPSATPTVVGATVDSWTLSENDTVGTLVISGVTGAVGITVDGISEWTTVSMNNVMDTDGETVLRYGIAQGNQTTAIAFDASKAINMVPEIIRGSSSGVGWSAGNSNAYFFPVGGNNKITIVLGIPSELNDGNHYVKPNVSFYNSSYGWISRASWPSGIVNEITADIPSNAAYFKVYFALGDTSKTNNTPTDADCEYLLTLLKGGSGFAKYKLFTE